MDELSLDGKTYISSKRSAQITGYAKDYVGQLCREGRVEARLVGRNWYVLEASIMAHRFGAESIKKETVTHATVSNSKPENEPIISDDIWKTTQYVPETRAELPVLQDSHSNLTSSSNSSEVVQQMQSAWHDWFSRTDQLNISKETLLEDHYTLEVEPEFIAEAPKSAPEVLSHESPLPDYFESGNTPITLQKVNAAITQNRIDDDYEGFGEAVPISIHRTVTPPAVVQHEKVPPSTQGIPTAILETTRLKDVGITEWESKKRVQKVRVDHSLQKAAQQPSLAVKAVLLSIAGLAIVIAVLGSGKLDTVLTRGQSNISVIKYLGGESSFTKT